MTEEEKRYSTGSIANRGTLAEFVSGADLATIIPPADPPSTLQVINEIAQSRETGLLGIDGGDETIALSLGRNAIIKTASSVISDDEELLDVMRAQRTLSASRLEPGVHRCMETGEPLDQVLYEMKLVKPREIVQLLRQVHQVRLYRALRFPEATFTFARTDLLGGKLAGSAVHLDLHAALRRYLADALHQGFLNDMGAALDQLGDKWVEMDSAAGVRAKEVGFSGREVETMVQIMNGTRRMSDLTNVSALSKAVTTRLIWMSVVLELAALTDDPPAAALGTQEDELSSLLKRLQKLDYFERLGSHWSRHPSEAKKYYEATRTAHTPGGRIAKLGGAIEGLCAQIVATLDEAWATVHSTAKRRAYRNELVPAGTMKTMSNTHFNQGTTCEFRAEFDEALRLFDTAMDLCQEDCAKEGIQRVNTILAEIRRVQLKRAAEKAE